MNYLTHENNIDNYINRLLVKIKINAQLYKMIIATHPEPISLVAKIGN